jgi:rubrerythrin
METAERTRFLHQLATTPTGREHMLSLAVEAEEGDEGGIFDQLAHRVDDAKLRRLVIRHRDDEVRHAQLYRDCLARLGYELQAIPDELKIIKQIASTTGGLEHGVRTTDDVVATYAMLLAIEERGVEQFPLIADAFRAVDPETADVYLRVARDERGHVRYCETIGRHYAADESTWQLIVAHTRALEATAFASVVEADRRYCIERGWVPDNAEIAVGEPMG